MIRWCTSTTISQALVGSNGAAATLDAAGLKARILDSGCCGMAGSFGFDKHHYGFDKHHYKVSLDVGERVLLHAVCEAAAATPIIGDGFSCREQIRQTTGRRAHDLAEIVCRQLGGEP